KNESNAKSDVDLFILGNVDEDTLLPEINKLEETLHREINYSLYSRKDFAKKKNNKDSFIKDVIENKKIFLIGDENDI
ncbi:MAG: ArsR family transcriptional regulator, partial [Candidatus Omnitrophota bacterium]